MIKEIKLKIKTEDFVELINNRTFKCSTEKLKHLRNEIKIKPKLINNSFKIGDEQFNNEFKKVSDNYLIQIELI